MILVIGATSRLGQAVMRKLAKRGARVRGACRRPARAQSMRTLGFDVAAVDLRRSKSFAPALEGVSAVFAAVHGLTGAAGDSIARVDVQGHQHLIDAAVQAGVRQFVYCSALDAALDHPAPFWRAKAQVEAHLKRSRLEWTILRLAAFMDFHAHELIGRSVMAGKPATILGAGTLKRNLVAVEDAAEIAAEALLSRRWPRETLAVGGPDNLSDREVAATYARLSGRPLKITAVPPAALGVLAALIRPFHAGIANILKLPIELQGRDLTFDEAGMA